MSNSPPRTAIAVGLRTAVLLVAVTGVALAARGTGALPSSVAELMRPPGALGPLGFVAAGVLLGTAGLPAPLLGAAAGVLYGALPGAALAWATLCLVALGQFLLARYVAGQRWRGLLIRRAGRLDRFLRGRGVAAVLVVRLLPAPHSEVSLAAGLTTVGLGAFLLGTAAGTVPRAFAWAALGGGLAALGTAWGGVAVGLYGLAAVTAALLWRRTGRSTGRPGVPPGDVPDPTPPAGRRESR